MKTIIVLAFALLVISAIGAEKEHRCPMPKLRVALQDGGGELTYDGLVVSYGVQENSFSVECHKLNGTGKGNLLLPSPDVHGAQLCQVTPGNCKANEVRKIPIRGANKFLILTITNAKETKRRFVSGEITIAFENSSSN